MFKRIVLTEENYEDILKKIKKTTNNYRMLTRFQVFKEDLDHEEKQYRRGFLLKSFRCVQNYEDILKKIKKTTNNYRMLTRFQVFKEDLDHEEKQYRRGFLLKSFRCVQKNGWIVMKHNFHKLNFFIKATEHFFKVAYDENPESFDGNMYIKMHSLIHMSMGVDSALVLGLGDSIMFLPFGGFVVYTSDSFIHFAYEPLTIYKETFIPDYLFGKIDFNKESTIRDNAIEAQNAIRADEMEKDFMLGYEI